MTIQSQRVFHVESGAMELKVTPNILFVDPGATSSSSSSNSWGPFLSPLGALPFPSETDMGLTFFVSNLPNFKEKLGMNFFFAEDVSLLRFTLVKDWSWAWSFWLSFFFFLLFRKGGERRGKEG